METDGRSVNRQPLLALLDKFVLGLAAVSLALRFGAGGAAAIEPETAFCQMLILSAFCLRMTQYFLLSELPVPPLRLLGGAGAFVVCLLLALGRAETHGAWQPAADLAANWGIDLLSLFLFADLGRDASTRRMMLAILTGGLLLVAAYGLYQRWYGLGYFRAVMETNPNLVTGTVGASELHRRMFEARIGSDRITGPFGYPNAVAACFLLLFPLLAAILSDLYRAKACAFLFGGKTERSETRWLRFATVAAGGVLLAGAYTGSKAGFLVACALQTALLLYHHRMTTGALCTITRVWDMLLRQGAAAVVSLLIFAVSYRLTGMEEASIALGSAVWMIFLYRFWNAAPLPLSKRLRWSGGVLAVAGAAGFALLVALPVERLPGQLRPVKAEVGKHLGVRLGYWDAAARMCAASPLRGVGLDNFGQRYSQFRSSWAWSVKRAHNTLMQTAADGGLPLLLSLLALWGCVFSSFRRRLSPRNIPLLEPAYPGFGVGLGVASARFGLAAGLMAGGVLFLFFTRGIFAGLSLEFIWNELYGTAQSGSRWAQGNPGALLVHAGAHFLLLPLAWAGGFWLAWRYLDGNRCGGWIVLGAAAFLFHGLFDLDYTNSTLYALFWSLCGLGLSGNAAWSRMRSASHARLAAMSLTGVTLALAWALGMPRLDGAVAAHLAENQVQVILEKPPLNEPEYRKALNTVNNALAARPGDDALYRLRSKLHGAWLNALMTSYASPRERDEAAQQMLGDWKKNVELQPWYADGYAVQAELLLAHFRNDPQTPGNALELLKRAASLAPQHPGYRLELARLKARLGDAAGAKEDAAAALRLHAATTDENLWLDEMEKSDAERLAQ